MIHAYGSPGPPAPRLLAALERRGHEVPRAAGTGPHRDSTLVLAGGSALEPMALGVLLGAWRAASGARVLVLSRLGAHPDARARALRDLWALEEFARGAGLPVLTLRLGPLVGAASPFWLRLARRPWIPRAGRLVVNPVAEDDVVDALDAALRGRVAWSGTWEVAGPEAHTLAELVEIAASSGVDFAHGRGAWEPALDELIEHRLAEGARWYEAFGLTARPIAGRAREWA